MGPLQVLHNVIIGVFVSRESSLFQPCIKCIVFMISAIVTRDNNVCIFVNIGIQSRLYSVGEHPVSGHLCHRLNQQFIIHIKILSIVSKIRECPFQYLHAIGSTQNIFIRCVDIHYIILIPKSLIKSLCLVILPYFRAPVVNGNLRFRL